MSALVLLFVAGAANAEQPVDRLSPLLAATSGTWTGELQYRDYQSNTWQGLPMTVRVGVQPDRTTIVRTASYDDGPQTGTVWITTVSQFDPASGKEAYAIFRKAREADGGKRVLTLSGTAQDAAHWTIVTLETRKDGDSIAQVRETTIRDGERMTTLKEVNPVGDDSDEWLPRNRTVLTRIRR